MEDLPSRCAVFCTAEIPSSTIDTLLNISQEYQLGSPDQFERNKFVVAEWMVIMTSEDISTIPHLLTQPIQPFQSPFIGKTIEELAAWYHRNIIQPAVPGFWRGSFIVIDEDALEEQICTVVNMKKGPMNIELLGCEFILGLQMASLLDLGHPMEDAVINKFMRHELLMTKENLELAMNAGRYMDGMEVKVDEVWKDFDDW